MKNNTPKITLHALPISVLLVALLLTISVFRLSACQDDAEPSAQARRVSSRADLIGGPSALGEVGDFLLENNQVRVIIQDKGFSRGFGVYGGSLIDADLIRPTQQGDDSVGGQGRDQFGELFPAFFLQALIPEEVEILSDGTQDDKTARIRVSGTGGDFLTLAKTLNTIALNSHEVDDLLNPDLLQKAPKLRYETVYELEPDVRYVRIRTSLTNITDEDLPIPEPNNFNIVGAALGVTAAELDVPMGHVVLFGAGNRVFMDGTGYDIRFGLEEAQQLEEPLPFPALPGLITRQIITTSEEGISYGFAADPVDGVQRKNFVQTRLQEDGTNIYGNTYPGAPIGPDSLLVPFLASSFTGVFYAQTPKVLAPNESYEYVSYFVIGDGDAGSVMDTLHSLRSTSTARLSGVVRDTNTGRPVEGASVLIYDANDRPINQYFTDAQGQFLGSMPPGDYKARVLQDPILDDLQPFSLPKDGRFLDLSSTTPGHITVRVRDSEGRNLPAKVTVVGTSDPSKADLPTRKHLFDLQAGQHFLHSDLKPDNPNDPSTLEYIETSGYTEDGTVTLTVRPNRAYSVYVSRGIEYDLQQKTVSVSSGEVEQISTVLTRVVDTKGYISADFHLHAGPSLDSDLPLHERVVSAAGEGLEFAVATDHNFITDYKPFIVRADLQDWINSMVGLEMTTLESGHFNGFPLDRKFGEITGGSFEWSQRTPDEVFKDLRALGAYGPENTIVQVNHARDSILGYFAQFGVDPLTTEATPPPQFLDAVLAPSGPTFHQFRDENDQPCYPGPYKDEDGDGKRDTDGCNLQDKENAVSFDFDAMEIFNGKRFDQIKHFRMPANIDGLDIPENVRENLPEPGTILCDGSGDIVYAGMLDDWFNLLNRGVEIAGTGNSDSHGTEGEEPGYPRTYIRVDKDNPANVTDMDVVEALRNQRLTVTNGPFVELFLNDQPIGSKVASTSSNALLRIRVQSPSWIIPNSVTIYGNGQPLETLPLEMVEKGGRLETTIERSFQPSKDTWYVVEVTGTRSMFPVVPPLEVPPLLIQDAIGSIAESILGGKPLGDDLYPSQVGLVTPYAITNPIWFDHDGNGFEPPGNIPRKCQGYGVVPVEEDSSKPSATAQNTATPTIDPEVVRKKTIRAKLKSSIWFPRERGNLHDLRIILEQFQGHSHGH